MNGAQVAARRGWSASKVSRFERSQTCIKPADVDALLKLYKVPGPESERLNALAVRAWNERYLEESDRFAVSEVLAWAPVSVPVLLRTEDYHRGIILSTAAINPISPGMVRKALDRNVIWQARLKDENPIRVRAVLDESVLLRRVRDSWVMRDQVQQLAELNEQESVTLRVLPMSRPAPSHLPPFTYTRFEGEEDMPSDEVEVATLCDPWTAEAERDAWLHYLAFEQLFQAAEDPGLFLKAALASWA